MNNSIGYFRVGKYIIHKIDSIFNVYYCPPDGSEKRFVMGMRSSLHEAKEDLKEYIEAQRERKLSPNGRFVITKSGDAYPIAQEY